MQVTAVQEHEKVASQQHVHISQWNHSSEESLHLISPTHAPRSSS